MATEYPKSTDYPSSGTQHENGITTRYKPASHRRVTDIGLRQGGEAIMLYQCVWKSKSETLPNYPLSRVFNALLSLSKERYVKRPYKHDTTHLSHLDLLAIRYSHKSYEVNIAPAVQT